LFTIDPRPLQAQVSMSEANLAQNAAQLMQAQANLARDIAQEKYAQSNAERSARLLQQGHGRG
jgi:multidrug resistance efflux pump